MPQITGVGTPLDELPPYAIDFACTVCRTPFRVVPGDRYRLQHSAGGCEMLIDCPRCLSNLVLEVPEESTDSVIYMPYMEYERLAAAAELGDRYHDIISRIEDQEHLFSRLDADFGDLFEGIRRLLERRPEQAPIERREDRGREHEPRRPAPRRRDPDAEWNPRGNYNPEVEERLAAAIVPDVQIGRRGGGGGSRAPITEGLRDD